MGCRLNVLRFVLGIVLFQLVSFPVIAQGNFPIISDGLNDEVLLGEFTQDYTFNFAESGSGFNWNRVNLIKLINGIENGVADLGDYTKQWNQLVLAFTKNDELLAFKDSTLFYPLERNQVIEALKVSRSYMNGCEYYLIHDTIPVVEDDLEYVRVRNQLYFDQPMNTFRVRVLAWAPLLTVREEENSALRYKPIFWLRPIEATTALLNNWSINPELTYVWETINTGNSQSIMEFNNPRFDYQHFLESLSFEQVKPLDAYTHQQLTSAEFYSRLSSVDTIPTFNSTKMQEEVTYIKVSHTKSMQELSLIIRWYWNTEGKLYYHQVGWSPVEKVLDDAGNLRYSFRPFLVTNH